ncbi:MAG TPA: HAD-IA family hydrolase [Candidatus Thermoplasmatota archaeon]|nr:HAD-IA family hydrolase [Candidatus Thermoplasmatota archaeon]
MAPPATGAPILADIRAVAFDLDSTLVDIIHIKRRAAEAAAWALVDAGVDLDPARMAEAIHEVAIDIGIDSAEVVEEYLKRQFGAPEPRLIEVGEHAFEKAEEENVRPYPRVHHTLTELSRRGYTLVLITDAPRWRAVRRLQAARLLHFFHRILTIEDTPHGKADGAPYAKAAKLLDLAPEQILMVGDHPGRDVAMARSAGLRAALAAYGLQPVFAETGGGILADLQLRYPDDLLRSLP